MVEGGPIRPWPYGPGLWYAGLGGSENIFAKGGDEGGANSFYSPNYLNNGVPTYSSPTAPFYHMHHPSQIIKNNSGFVHNYNNAPNTTTNLFQAGNSSSSGFINGYSGGNGSLQGNNASNWDSGVAGGGGYAIDTGTSSGAGGI
jgi:hypothetical protein